MSPPDVDGNPKKEKKKGEGDEGKKDGIEVSEQSYLTYPITPDPFPSQDYFPLLISFVTRFLCSEVYGFIFSLFLHCTLFPFLAWIPVKESVLFFFFCLVGIGHVQVSGT